MLYSLFVFMLVVGAKPDVFRSNLCVSRKARLKLCDPLHFLDIGQIRASKAIWLSPDNCTNKNH